MKSLLFLTVLLLAWAASAVVPQAVAQEVDIEARPTITVPGKGTVSRPPDIAFVNLGVEAQAPSAREALDENNRAMQQLLDTLERQEIPAKQVQTSSFNIAPLYHHDPDGRTPPQITGYQVSNQVRVKVSKVDRLGALLDAVVDVGANRIHGVQFDIDKPEEATDEARKKAVADARRKAELLAEAAGARIGRPLKIEEATGTPPPMPMQRMAMMAESVPVAQGEQEVTAELSVTYELLDGAEDEDDAEDDGEEDEQ